jgi:hypothetical protein
MNICPRCGYQNRSGVLICDECGVSVFDDIFSHTRVVAQQPDYSVLTAPLHNTGMLVRDRLVVLEFVGAPPIRTQLDQAMVIGRMNRHSPHRPDIDLTAYHAFEKGVSTRHALLGCENDRLRIADLGSTNGSWVNGESLIPHESFALRNGDELRLGQLFIQISFADESDPYGN